MISSSVLTPSSSLESPSSSPCAFLRKARNMDVAAAEKVAAADDREDRLSAALTDYYRDRIAAHGTADPQAALDMLRMDIKLNVQGLLVWLKRLGAF